jgi:hypothetical protein
MRKLVALTTSLLNGNFTLSFGNGGTFAAGKNLENHNASPQDPKIALDRGAGRDLDAAHIQAIGETTA